MAEVEKMAIDVPEEKNTIINDLDQEKKTPRKRKRLEPCLFAATPEATQAKMDNLREEINGLVTLYKDLILETRRVLVEHVGKMGNSSLQSVIACFMEESDLPLSKLVDRIFEDVKGRVANIESLTKVVVKSTVLLIGQRVCYGVSCADADVLEDEVECALWCWETRDLKLMPTCFRSSMRVRRACRKKIQDRISAISALIGSLENLGDHQNGMQAVQKASEKLDKVLNEAKIKLFMNEMAQKNEMAEKETKKQENLLGRQMEKRQREMEKERKKMERQLQKEKLQNEKEQKRLNDEAEKERRRREKEVLELQKQLKKQQEESEKEQRRKEKEAIELKKQLKLQKQASLMERFLKRNKTSSQHDNSINEATPSELSSNIVERKSDSVAVVMDSVLAQNDVDANAIWKSHLDSWRRTGGAVRSNKKAHWGIRQKPKAEIAKDFKLASNKELTCEEEVIVGKLAPVDSKADGKLQLKMDMDPLSDQKQPRAKQLLQFDKCFRPSFYGVWPNRSKVVGPRRPFAKDPDVDYEIDSDEEWEEDEPGESLSDCDRDDADESMEGNLKEDDTDETEDGFFVPDGYLSEDERAQTDEMESDELVEKICDLPDSEKLVQSEEFCSLLRKQKNLNTLTEHALKKNKPLIVLNFMHEKSTLLSSEELAGAEKVERTCLQTLCILPFPDFPVEIIPVVSYTEDEDLESSSKKSAEQPLANANVIMDADLPHIISIINSSGHSIGKIVEQLHENFPAVSKSQLRGKVREISEFSDNRWQVKKEVLSTLGLSISPEKNGSKAKNIASFFSKRCLPPSGKTVNLTEETSPEQSKRHSATASPHSSDK